ncbi:ankyrin [Ascobolus immersus RN42]|uniref:Ankyrin n=1 Tax=Ascobolus immersus RN42 TaxID=1160509 RepID=A0A3N4I8R0_ASCIM|nr:ankyrin [Ascobolus immersus RN42]
MSERTGLDTAIIDGSLDRDSDVPVTQTSVLRALSNEQRKSGPAEALSDLELECRSKIKTPWMDRFTSHVKANDTTKAFGILRSTDFKPMERNIQGETLLHLLVTQQDMNLLSCALNVYSIHKLVNCRNYKGETPFHYAAKSGSHEAFGRLPNEGGDISIADAEGVTPLHLAAAHGNGERLLKEVFFGPTGKVDATIQDDYKRSVYHHAAMTGSIESVRILFQKGRAKKVALFAPDRFGNTPFHYAAGRDDGTFLEALLRFLTGETDGEQKAALTSYINEPSPSSGYTPLGFAAFHLDQVISGDPLLALLSWPGVKISGVHGKAGGQEYSFLDLLIYSFARLGTAPPSNLHSCPTVLLSRGKSMVQTLKRVIKQIELKDPALLNELSPNTGVRPLVMARYVDTEVLGKIGMGSKDKDTSVSDMLESSDMVNGLSVPGGSVPGPGRLVAALNTFFSFWKVHRVGVMGEI